MTTDTIRFMYNTINNQETKSESGNNPIAHGNSVGIWRILLKE